MVKQKKEFEKIVEWNYVKPIFFDTMDYWEISIFFIIIFLTTCVIVGVIYIFEYARVFLIFLIIPILWVIIYLIALPFGIKRKVKLREV